MLLMLYPSGQRANASRRAGKSLVGNVAMLTRAPECRGDPETVPIHTLCVTRMGEPGSEHSSVDALGIRPPDAFAIEVRERTGEALVIVLEGEFDLAAAPALRDELDEARGSGVRRVVLDFTAVTFVDSSALRELLRARTAYRAERVELVLAALRPAVVRCWRSRAPRTRSTSRRRLSVRSSGQQRASHGPHNHPHRRAARARVRHPRRRLGLRALGRRLQGDPRRRGLLARARGHVPPLGRDGPAHRARHHDGDRLRAPHRIVLRARARPAGVARVELELAERGAGTEVVMHEKPVSGPPALLHNPLQDWLIDRRNREGLSRLKRLAEQS
jgi:anti-anti-sigma factor